MFHRSSAQRNRQPETRLHPKRTQFKHSIESLAKPFSGNAQRVAAQFGFELEPGQDLRPLHELDRLRPHQDDLAISCGKLAIRIVEELDGFEAEDYNAIGRGYTQDGRKSRNVPKIKQYVADQ